MCSKAKLPETPSAAQQAVRTSHNVQQTETVVLLSDAQLHRNVPCQLIYEQDIHPHTWIGLSLSSTKNILVL